MTPKIAGYDIEGQLETFFATALFAARDRETGSPVVLKVLTDPYPHKDDIKRLEREFRVLSELSGASGVLPSGELLRLTAGVPAIVAPVKGETLRALLARGEVAHWPVTRIVEAAIELVSALSDVHGAGIIHKNLAPRNILVGPASEGGGLSLHLMNFEIAAVLSTERQERAMSRRLRGSLPYIAPEQTGRMAYDLDYRTDFYSLGIVLYEMLTGASPFQANTRLEWVHAHISRAPERLTHDASGRALPEPLADIVMALLAKSPDDRYQSSFGLLHDLRHCLSELAVQGEIAPFALRQRDVSEVFSIPQVLIGRERELGQLEDLYREVEEGAPKICLIAGYSGVGKSALVDGLNVGGVRASGFFIRGKFDQFERATPYAAIAAAFTGFVHEILTESAEVLADWRARISRVIAPNGAALCEIVPDLERIIGPQPELPSLPPTEAHNRLQIVVLNLLREISGPDAPLVLYLDDLQWSDGPTLRLLQNLATARDLPHVMILGAYRDNEVDTGHLLSLARAEIEKSREVHELHLDPLPERAVTELVALSLRASEEDVTALAKLLHAKTEGNPFFVKELLRTLVEDRLITFDRQVGRWRWDVARVRRADIGDGVVGFLISNLSKLAKPTREALQFAACLGNSFDLHTLAAVAGASPTQLGPRLVQAVERNILLPLDDGYQYFDKAAGEDTHPGATALDDVANPRFQFQHDRLHQAAYEGLSKSQRQDVHLSIGRLLQSEAEGRNSGQIGGAEAMAIVRHFNEARVLISEPAAREALARLNLAAAEYAHDASSFMAALDYVETGRALLPPDAWSATPALAKSLSMLYAQTCYLTGRIDASEAEIDAALECVPTALEKAQLLSMRTRHYSTLGRMQDSIDAALQGLRLLGVDIEADLPDDVVAAEIAAIDANLAGRAIRDLVLAERMEDPVASCAVGLLMEIFPAAFLSGSGNLFHFLIAKSVNISLEHGNSAETAFAYAAFGMLLCGALGDPARGLKYGQLALDMNEQFEDIGLKSRIIYVYAMFIHHWSHHWASMTEWFKKGLEAGYQSGDLLYLAYNAQDCIIWDPALDVEAAIGEQERYLEIVADTNYRDSYDSGSLFLQMLKNFAGQTVSEGSLSSEGFDETACLQGMIDRKFMTGVANYHIYKAEVHLLYGNYAEAAVHVAEQDKLIASVMSLPQLTRFRFISTLTHLGLAPSMEPDARDAFAARLGRDLAQMTVWAENCPENFAHICRMIGGAQCFLAGDISGGLRDFAAAQRLARDHGYLRDEAVLSEWIGAILLSEDLEEPAQLYLAKARYLFERWGAVRKVAQMEARYAGVSLTAAKAGESGPDELTALDSLDLASVMKAAQAISGELKLSALLERTMSILLESAGAQRGVFALKEPSGLSVEIAQNLEGPEDVEEGAVVLPETIAHYVLRTRAPLVLDNACEEDSFHSDLYVAARQTRSVLCVPILRADTFEGVIYLENDLAAGAFTADRVAIVEMLAAQAAISIENARFYVELERKVADRTAELSHKSAELESLASQLSKYLSPQVYRSIFDQKQEVKLASARKRLTVFFSDLVGFTSTADTLESEDVTRILNHYLAEMSEIALAHGATIDKFMGDGIVIFFGDPESRGVQQDAEACVRMAIAMRERLHDLKREWRAQGIENPMDARMGIHTGYCAVGNFGSESRMDYTIIGGTVNLAARLEATADPGAILISYETHAAIRDAVHCERRSQISVKGIARPVQTYEVVDLVENLDVANAPIREESEAMSLSLDPARMSAEDRLKAVAALKDAARKLEVGLGPAPQKGKAGR